MKYFHVIWPCTILFCFQYCRVPDVFTTHVSFSNLQQPNSLNALAELSKLWLRWDVECYGANISMGTFQMTVSGGVGNTTTRQIYIGPFTG